MSEKRVSVRLSATGGKQVKAELTGVGEAGAKGMGRLARETEIANAKLAAFARRAKVFAAATAVAAVAAGAAMVRSGLQTIDAQAKLAQSLGTTVGSIQVLERAGDLAGVSIGEIEQATAQLTRRLSQAASGTGPAAAALDKLQLSAAELQRLPLDERIALIQERLSEFVPEAQRAAVASQLFGDRASLVFTRIDSATLRQANKDLIDFGVIVSEQDAEQIEVTNDAISRLGLLWRGVTNQLTVAVAPALEAVVNGLVAFAKVTGPLGVAIRFTFDNLTRFATYAATFVGLMAGRWMLAMGRAALSVKGLTTAFVFLRGAIIRTGIGALIVGAGELVFWFTKLVSGAGGFGNALALLKDVAAEVWSRIKMGASAAGAAATAMFYDIKSDAAAGMASAIESVVGFGNATANTFEGALLAVKEIWSRLPSVIGDLVFTAANRMLDGIGAMLNGALGRIDAFTGKIRDALAAVGIETTFGQIGEISLGDITNPFAGASAEAGTAAAEAFQRAFAKNPLTAPDLGLSGLATDALATANSYRQAASDLAAGATLPLASWQALRDAVSGADAEGEDALSGAATSAAVLTAELEDTETAATRAGAAARQAGTDAKEGGDVAATGWRAVAQGLSQYADQALDWGKSLSDTLVGAFRSAENAFRDFVKTGKVDFKGLIASILTDLAVLQFRKAVLGPIANALSSAFAGPGIGGSVAAAVSHTGGMVGISGYTRSVPAMAFAGAPRMHAGGMAGLRPDEVPTILQRGERVLNRRETAQYGARTGPHPVEITVNVQGARGNREIEEMVDRGVSGALQQYDRLIAPRTVARVSQDPRRSG
jgi:hypothetical protein